MIQFVKLSNSLLQTKSGILFMNTFNDFYYSFSPSIADYERENHIIHFHNSHHYSLYLLSIICSNTDQDFSNK